MGIARGPNLIKDNLVFGYDTGYGVADNFTATRFYPGEPADNLLFKTGAVNLTTGGDIYVNAVKTSLGNGRYKFVNDSTGGTTIRLYCNLSDLTNGQSYAISLFYEKLVGSLSADWCDTSITSYNNTNGKITGIGTRSTYTSTYRFLDINLSNGGSVILSNPQIESNSHTTPFVDGTRSDTASLIDLKRTRNIDLSSSSFTSTGQPDFDGSSDSVLVGNVGGYSDKITVESIFKTSSSATWKNMLCGVNGDIIFTVYQAKLNFGCQGSSPIPHTNYSTTNVNDGQFHHGVATYDGSSVKIYVDGVLESTTTRSGTITPSTLRAGSNSAGNSEFFNGSIPLVKLYNKALTATEIKQNYNAYKNRFNL